MALFTPRQARRDRLSVVDIASLSSVEIRAILVHLTGHEDPRVSDAVIDCARLVLARTRTVPCQERQED